MLDDSQRIDSEDRSGWEDTGTDLSHHWAFVCLSFCIMRLINEPRREKTCLRGDTNRSVQPQKTDRGLTFRI